MDYRTVCHVNATLALMRHRPSSTNALLFVVCLAQFMVILDVAVVNIALPSMRAGLHFSTTGLQWVVNAYTLTFAGFLMLGGRCADLLGRRRVFLAGTALFVLSSLACALMTARTGLIAARALQGFGGAIVSPAIFAINVPVGALVIVMALRVIPTDLRSVGPRNFDVTGAVLVTAGIVSLTYGIVRTDALGWGSAGVLGPLALAVLLLGAFAY